MQSFDPRIDEFYELNESEITQIAIRLIRKIRQFVDQFISIQPI